MPNLRPYWGTASALEGGVIVLRADREAADGIGSCLVAVPWDGRPLHLETSIVDKWREEAWADLWIMARESAEANPHPMRYVRFVAGGFEFGESLGPDPSDQRIHLTRGGRGGRQVGYLTSWREGVQHIQVAGGETYSMPAPVCELLLYCEASCVRVKVRDA